MDFVTRHAVIFGNRASFQHETDVSRAASFLEENDYQVHQVTDSERFEESLAIETDANDELFIYAGQDVVSSADGFCLQQDRGESCIDWQKFSSHVNTLPFQKRTVFFNHPRATYGAPYFINNPRTYFFSVEPSAIHADEELFWDTFWSDDRFITDANNDGIMGWGERFYEGLALFVSPHDLFNPFSFRGREYEDSGVSFGLPEAPFNPEVKKLKTEGELREVMEEFKNETVGQEALLLFSAVWCVPCQSYKPTFEEFAHRSDGNYLFVIMEEESNKIGWMKTFGVDAIPTVIHLGNQNREEMVVMGRDRRNHVLEEMPYDFLDPEPTLLYLLTLFGGSVDPEIQTWARRFMAAKIGREAVPRLIEALDDADPFVRANAVVTLGQIREEAALFAPLLVDLLNDPDPTVRKYAYGVLKTVLREATPTLQKTARQRPDSALCRAATQLLEIGVSSSSLE